MQIKKLITALAPAAIALADQSASNTTTPATNTIKISDPIIYDDVPVAIPERLLCVPVKDGPCEINTQTLVSESTTDLVRGLLKTAVPSTISHVTDKLLNSISELVEAELVGLLDSAEEDTILKRITLRGHGALEDIEAVVGYHVGQALEKHFVLMLRGVESERVVVISPEQSEEAFLKQDVQTVTTVFEESKKTLLDLGYNGLVSYLKNFGDLDRFNKVVLDEITGQDPVSKPIYSLVPYNQNFFESIPAQVYDESETPRYVQGIKILTKILRGVFSSNEPTVEIQVGLDDITVEQGHELMVDIAGVLASF